LIASGAALAFCALVAPRSSAAQDMSSMPGMSPSQSKAQPPQQSATAPAPSPQPNGPDMSAMPGMTSAQAGMGGMTMMGGQLGHYSMMRDGSGTSWQPDSTPMEGFDWASGGWSGMVHGYVDLVYDDQSGPRGDTKTFSESMLMVMGQHAVGSGTLTLRSMFSLDPAMGADGYPLLLQTGETADGVVPLIDRQHPHNLFMELAGVYSAPLGGRWSTFLYVGYPGEPALGPVNFMHRFSGMDDPAAPITHHWMDSTHITFGVLTEGVVHGPWKLEGSVFNGREPDQFRWGFNPLRLDSYSGRLSFNPTPDWALQVSYGYIHSPEQLAPDVSQHRVTASATYNRPLKGGNWQTTFSWGRNYDEPGARLDGLLLESAVNFGRQTLFARAETVQKDELFLAPSPFAGQVFRVSELSLGYVYDLPVAKHVALGLGVAGTVNVVPAVIGPAYGGENPTGLMPFLRLKLR
jgi:hypothetical protein